MSAVQYTTHMVLVSSYPTKDVFQINHSLFTRRKKALTSGRRIGKNLCSSTADRTPGLWLCVPVLCRSSITPLPPLYWIIQSSSSTNVSASLFGDCHVGVYSLQRPTPSIAIFSTDLQPIDHLTRPILTVTKTSIIPFSFHPSKESTDIRTEKGKNSGSAIGDRT